MHVAVGLSITSSQGDIVRISQRCYFWQKIESNPIQSNPIFIVKTQLTERSRITYKDSEKPH